MELRYDLFQSQDTCPVCNQHFGMDRPEHLKRHARLNRIRLQDGINAKGVLAVARFADALIANSAGERECLCNELLNDPHEIKSFVYFLAVSSATRARLLTLLLPPSDKKPKLRIIK